MNNVRKCVSHSVYFLSVVCALLIGFIVGYFLAVYQATEYGTSLEEDQGFKSRPSRGRSMLGENTVRDDIFYHGPDSENIWRGGFKEIPKGDTRIKGRVLLNGRPMDGLKLALLFAPGRKTETATTNANGEYEISLPEDQYLLYAVLCYNRENELADKICVNILAAFGGYTISPIPLFSERTKKEMPVLMPDIEYRDPVQIVSPNYGSREKLDRLRFSWTPYPGAESYIVEISGVIKKGSITTYEPVMVSQVQKDSVDYAELLRTLKRPEFGRGRYENRMEEKRWYTIRVRALDVNGKDISASSEFSAIWNLFGVD